MRLAVDVHFLYTLSSIVVVKIGEPRHTRVSIHPLHFLLEYDWQQWNLVFTTDEQHLGVHTHTHTSGRTRSNMQQHVATRCNTLQHTDSTHTSTFQTLTHSGLGEHMHALQYTHTPQHTEPHCITLQHTHAHKPQDVRRCPVQIWANTHILCKTLHHTAAHTATYAHLKI